MKRLKKKLKRALAAFLREELMEQIGYDHNQPYINISERLIRVHELPFETVVMSQAIPWDTDAHELERIIHDCKYQFARRVMDHIHVEAQDLTSDRSFGQRSVRFVLRVQGKK